MDEENRGLLAEVIKKNLEYAKTAGHGSDEEKVAFKQAMEAIDRQTNISKVDEAYNEHSDKLEAEKSRLETIEKEKIEIEKQKNEIEKAKMEMEKLYRKKENEFKKSEAKKAWIFRGIEIVAIYLLSPVIDKKIKESFAKLCMIWEKDNTFTGTPGKSVKDFFRFKR